MVKTALERLEGVKQAKVTFNHPEAVVRYDDEKVTPDALVRAVEKAGFRSKPVPQ